MSFCNIFGFVSLTISTILNPVLWYRNIFVLKEQNALLKETIARLNIENRRLSTYDVEKLIHSSLEMGISVMDHADIYGEYKCEEIFGRALKKIKK